MERTLNGIRMMFESYFVDDIIRQVSKIFDTYDLRFYKLTVDYYYFCNPIIIRKIFILSFDNQ